jgi:DNA-directed RNA polymerase beta' subunit
MSIYKELSYDQEIDIVKGIQFGVLSNDEVLKRSVVEVTKSDTFSGNEPVDGGLFDRRMGVLDHNRICYTCEQKNIFCPGHFGHIVLARPVFHAMFFDTVRKLMRCVCFRCSRLVANKALPEVVALLSKKTSMQKRWDTMYKLCNKMSTSNKPIVCPSCLAVQPIRYTKEPILRMFAEWKEEKVASDAEVVEGAVGGNIKRELTVEEVLRIFQRITKEDMEILGFIPEWNRPEWMISTVLPVPPPAVRPSVTDENGKRCEDDLTHKLAEIIKYNKQLKTRMEKPNATQENLVNVTQLLQYHCATFMDNQIPGLPPAQQRNGRRMKSISDRLKSKNGRIRGNLNGKRVDQSARSVITPDPYISIDELGVPIKIAMNQTFPEVVNKHIFEHLQKLVRNGPDVYPGAKYIRKTSDGRTITLKHADREKVANEMQIGDIVDRHMHDGDYILFNRQPSLHKMSMMAHRVRVMPYQSFRLNVLSASPYNAD